MGAITVVLAWLNLLGDIRQLPFLGIYVIMFFDILRTFFKFAVIFLLFIIAFGLGFHALILTTSEVNDTPQSCKRIYFYYPLYCRDPFRILVLPSLRLPL